ncbi:high mobility group protein [Stylonychia lemnae]|uniref:High mobility group protein n=1 Tax=Stylonychia lemnae TaxID=5949 RepID=A0A077ZWD5_STYLE|nr:high mobility group protein [Stylonychia lemnae]|eukprot:CDW72756.1 high mobility group protein [Stylonychia lemnae]
MALANPYMHYYNIQPNPPIDNNHINQENNQLNQYKQSSQKIFDISRGAAHELQLEDLIDWEKQVKTDRIISNDSNCQFECIICSNLLLDPVDCITCDTSFCKHCILEYQNRQQLKNNQNINNNNNQDANVAMNDNNGENHNHDDQRTDIQCPLGCAVLNLKPVHKNTRQKLNDIRIKCIFAPDCPEIERYESLHKHEDDCKFNRIRCPNYDKCKSYFKIQDKDVHLSNCIVNDYQCKVCNQNDCRFDNVNRTRLKKFNANTVCSILQKSSI